MCPQMFPCPFLEKSYSFGDLLLLIVSKVHGMPQTLGNFLSKNRPYTIWLQDSYWSSPSYSTSNNYNVLCYNHAIFISDNDYYIKNSIRWIARCERWCRILQISVREYRRVIRNGQSRESCNIRKTKKNKTKTQHNMCWTPLCANIAIYALLLSKRLYWHCE